MPDMKIGDFTNRVNSDEAAHDEPPYLELLHCLIALWSLTIQYYTPELDKTFLKVCRCKFCHLLFGTKKVNLYTHTQMEKLNTELIR